MPDASEANQRSEGKEQEKWLGIGHAAGGHTFEEFTGLLSRLPPNSPLGVRSIEGTITQQRNSFSQKSSEAIFGESDQTIAFPCLFKRVNSIAIKQVIVLACALQ